jgi:hypothetical protein
MRGLVPRAILLLALALPACSVWNRPAPFDGGRPDTPIPLDAPDAGADAPDAADAPPARPRETNCTDGVDNDMDGLVDCGDPDCASDVEACCSSDRPGAVIDDDWCTGISSAWDRRGSLVVSDIAPAPCFLSGASAPTAVDSMVHATCVPLVSGAVIQATLDWQGPCEACEAMVALSPVSEAGPSGVLEDLALRMHEDTNGNVVVDLTRAGRVLGTLPATGSLSGIVDATLTIFPALDDTGHPVLRAMVHLAWGGSRTADLEAIDAIEHPIVLTDAAGGCDVAPGLFLAVQSRGGNAARIGAVSAQPQQCANPNSFRPAGLSPGFPGDAVWLEAPDLGFTAMAEWTAGGIGAGATVPVRTGGMLEWHWFVDGSNLNRANDPDRDLDFSIGGSHAERLGLTGFVPRRSGGPMAGHAVPTCTMGPGDCGVYDFHEPTFFVPRGADGVIDGGRIPFALWVSRAPTGVTTLVYDGLTSFTSDTETLSNTPTLLPTTCSSPSHPAILSRDPSGAMGHFLVFVCGGEVWGMQLRTDLSPVAGTETMLFTRDDVGFPRGIVDVDGAVFGGVYRLWVAGRDLRGLTRVALTEARIPTGAGPPDFVPFGGNPVLSIDDPIFTRGPDRCAGVCRMTGVGVAREPGATTWSPRVRVLVSVTDEGAVLRHAIVPLEQIMP